jgi:hypothetical protein
MPTGARALADLAAPTHEEWSAAEAAVSAWRYTRPWADRWSLAPLAMARRGAAPGKDLARRPDADTSHEEHGYDEHGRLVVSRRWLDGRADERQLVHYKDGFAEARRVNDRGATTVVARFALEGDRVVHGEQLLAPGPGWGFFTEKYHYRPDHLLSSVEFRREGPGIETAGGRFSVGTQLIAYDGDRTSTVTEVYRGGETRVIWTRPRASGLETLREEIVRLCHRAVVQALTDMSASSPLSLIAIRYAFGGSAIPVVSVCDQETFTSVLRGGDPYVALNPAEWGDAELPAAEDESLLGKAAELEDLASERSVDIAQRIATDLASMLHATDVRSLTAVAEDLSIYATDFDLTMLGPDTPYLTARHRALLT